MKNYLALEIIKGMSISPKYLCIQLKFYQIILIHLYLIGRFTKWHQRMYIYVPEGYQTAKNYKEPKW